MTETKSIRREISDIFGILIEKGKWDSTFEEFARENRLNNLTTRKILVVILKRLEEMENDK